MLRALRQERQGDAQKPVKAEFLQDPGMQHRGGRGRGSVGFRRPGVKREERNEYAETDEEKQENLVLRARRDAAIARHRLQRAEVETAQFRRHAAIKQIRPSNRTKLPIAR